MSNITSSLYLPLFTLHFPQKALANYDVTLQEWYELMAAMSDVDLSQGNIANTFITLESFCEIGNYAKTFFGGEDRFLDVYLEEMTPAQLGPAGMMFASAPTLGDGIRHWVSCGKHVLPMLFIDQHYNDTHYYTTNEYVADIGPLSTTLLELLIMLTIRMIQLIYHNKARIGVQFRHQQYLPSSLYEKHLGFVPTFGATESGLLIDRQDLDLPNSAYSLFTYQQALETLRLMIAEANSQERYSHRVWQILVNAGVRGQFYSLDEVLDILNCSTRTLSRNLAAEGTTFREIQAEVRMEVAKRLLLKPGAVIKNVYERAGFNDLSSFSRAFHRYTKYTPREFIDKFRGKS